MEVEAAVAEQMPASTSEGTTTVSAVSAAPPEIGATRKIKVGDNVILCLNEDKFIFAQVQPTGYVSPLLHSILFQALMARFLF